MKKLVFGLTTLLALVLSSCNPAQKENNSNNTASGSEDVSSDTSSNEHHSSDDPLGPIPSEDDGWRVSYIDICYRKEYVKINKNFYPIIYYYDEEGNDISSELSDEEKDVTYTSSNESVLRVYNNYRFEPIGLGEAYVTVTTTFKPRSARCLIKVVNDPSSLTKEYRLMSNDDIDTLAPGDVLVFGVSSQGVTATTETSSSDLLSVSSTFSDNKITSMGEGTAEFIVSGSYNKWKLEAELSDGKYKYFAAFNLNRVGFVNKGNIEWEIGVDVDDNKQYVQSHSNVLGWMMYNVDTHKFSMYDSNETEHMKLIQLYRETIIE